MPLSPQQQLISDTLHYRPKPGSTSFVVNKPGLELISGDVSFLSPVKTALLEAARSEDWKRLYGLSYLVGAFLILGSKYDSSSLVPFIKQLPQDFKLEMLSNIPAFFNKSKETGQYNFSVPPSPELVEYISDLADGEDLKFQKLAKKILNVI